MLETDNGRGNLNWHHFCFHQPNQNQPFFNNTVLSNRCQFQSRYNYNAQKPSSLTLLFENQFQFNHMNCFCMIKNILHAGKYWWILVLCDKIEIEMITLVMTSQVMMKKSCCWSHLTPGCQSEGYTLTHWPIRGCCHAPENVSYFSSCVTSQHYMTLEEVTR